MFPVLNCRVSPSEIVLEAVIAPCHNRFPDDTASKIPMWVTEPHEAPDAVKEISPLLDAVSPVTVKVAD